MLPESAKLDAVLSLGVVLYDVSHLLTRTRTNTRADKIVRVYHHHSGALGRGGYPGLRGSVRYVVKKRDFPGPAYTYWLSYEPDRDELDRIVVYRANPDSERSYHTGGAANDHGVAIAWQGNLTKRQPSADQYEAAEALMAWLVERHGLSLPDGVSYHAESKQYGGSGKKACPGPHVTAWVEGWRSQCR